MPDIIEHQPQPTGQAVTIHTSMNQIAAMMQDKDLDPEKLHSLLDFQERLMARQAELEFNTAYIRMQDELPRITKDSAIKHGHGRDAKVIAKYASYEKIDDVIRPILKRHGFAMRFNSGPNGGEMIVEGTLSHIGGHSITDRIPLKVEKVAAMNSAQAAMSAITYAKRGLATMILNLVFEGEDDDGKNADYAAITDDQAAIIKDLIRETNTNTVAFLKTMVSGANSVEEIALKDFDRVLNTLNAKKAKAVQQ